MAEPLTVLGEAPQAIPSAPDGSRVRELLALYQETLDTADDLPVVPMVLRKHGDRLHYLPRPKWLVRYFLVGHVRRSLTGLSRRYSARAALEQAALGEEDDRETVREFQQSLPPDRQKVYIVLLIAAIVVIFRPIIDAAVPMVISAAKAGARSPESQHLRQEALDTVDKAEKALNANVTAIDQALIAVLTGGPLHFGIVTLGVALSAYVVLLPFSPAFRLKRMLFNLAPEPKRRHRSAVARWSVSQATGLYESERRVFAELGARPPKEFPLDLAVSALAMALPLAYCGLLFRVGAIALSQHDRPWLWRALPFYMTASVLIAILVRLGWLCRTWQRRQLGRSGPYRPFDVGIRSGGTVTKVENPIWQLLLFFWVFFLFAPLAGTIAFSEGAGLAYAFFMAVAVGLVYSLPPWLLVSLPWWYRINRELRDLDRSYDSQKAAIRPLQSLLMITVGSLGLLPPYIAVFRVGRHIQRAQSRAGQPITAWPPWILAFGWLLAPVLFAYLQRELNKIWKVEGQPLDPWPAESSPEANRSTGTLPWLKAKRSTD